MSVLAGGGPMLVLDGPHRAAPAGDIGTGPALLAHAVATGVSVLRVYRPRPTTAFSRLDMLAPGCAAAVDASTRRGFEPVLRAPGGRAASYHEDSVCLDLVVADPSPRERVEARFAALGELISAALRTLGVPAEVGAVPGEYCPGRFSVRAGGLKLAGTAQRVVRGAWAVGAVVVVDRSGDLREVVGPVYDALGLDCDVGTVGAVTDVAPGVGVEDVTDALLAGFARVVPLLGVPASGHHPTVPLVDLDGLLATAADHAPRHRLLDRRPVPRPRPDPPGVLDDDTSRPVHALAVGHRAG